MRILALNPYHGGSHKAFIDGWIKQSRHEFQLFTLPAYKWKWRMRHAPVTFAEQLTEKDHQPNSFDALICTDMLNLAEFRGLCSSEVRRLPSVVYFHENQLTYPNREANERDLHFAFTNITTCLAADAVWFNSAFHRDSFLAAASDWMRRMPDYPLNNIVDQIRSRSSVHPPGIGAIQLRQKQYDGPLRILWVSRWEHDKAPDTFFESLKLLKQRAIDFRISVLGESFGDVPACFEKARNTFAAQIDRWGYAASREAYLHALQTADVVVSTANHEFFGIAIIEAVRAGCFPLVPRRLAYPEVLGDQEDFFYDGTVTGLADRLETLSQQVTTSMSCRNTAQTRSGITQKYTWPVIANRMDLAIEQIVHPPNTKTVHC